jgi:hypothetical protein
VLQGCYNDITGCYKDVTMVVVTEAKGHSGMRGSDCEEQEGEVETENHCA